VVTRDPARLGRVRSGHVAGEDPDAERAVGEVGLQPCQDPVHLRRSGRALPARILHVLEQDGQPAVQRHPGERLHAGHGPRGREAVVHRAAGAGRLRVGGGDGGDARLELERGRHAVHGLQALAAPVVGVAVDVDEAGGYHLAGYVEVEAAGREVRPDAGHPVAGDRHVPHGVQARFRVDDPAASQHYVELSHNGSTSYPDGRGYPHDDPERRRA
jgi:hypothetical protein